MSHRAQRRFQSQDVSPAVVVYVREAGISAADRRAVEADARSLGTLPGLVGPVAGPVPSRDGKALELVVPLDANLGSGVSGTIDTVRHQARSGLPAGASAYVSGPAAFSADLVDAFAGRRAAAGRRRGRAPDPGRRLPEPDPAGGRPAQRLVRAVPGQRRRLLAREAGRPRSLGPVAAFGIIGALLAALTFLPAVLVLLGRAAFWPRRPTYGSEHAERSGVWGRVARTVGRRPRAIWVASTVGLLLLAAFLPTLRAHGTSQSALFLNGAPSVTASTAAARHFPAARAAPRWSSARRPRPRGWPRSRPRWTG